MRRRGTAAGLTGRPRAGRPFSPIRVDRAGAARNPACRPVPAVRPGPAGRLRVCPRRRPLGAMVVGFRLAQAHGQTQERRVVGPLVATSRSISFVRIGGASASRRPSSALSMPRSSSSRSSAPGAAPADRAHASRSRFAALGHVAPGQAFEQEPLHQRRPPRGRRVEQSQHRDRGRRSPCPRPPTRATAGCAGRSTSSSCRSSSRTMGRQSAAGRRLAEQASWLRTVGLVSRRARAISRSRISGDTFLSSPSRRTVQARTSSLAWSSSLAAKVFVEAAADVQRPQRFQRQPALVCRVSSSADRESPRGRAAQPGYAAPRGRYQSLG